MNRAHRTYEIRADNPDPSKAGEWAVYAVGGNEHSRRIACTTVKSEAEVILTALLAMPKTKKANAASMEREV